MRDVLMRLTPPNAPDAQVRASAAASQMMGLLLGRYVLALPALVSATKDELVAIYGPTMQRYLAGALTDDGSLAE